MSEYTTEQLTELYNQWTTIERERIIKLLDTLATQEPDYAQVFIHNLKVLIKGENK